MSKLSFRARALDPSKPLPIFFSDQEPDILNPNASISRAVPQMPTGMEKEEEEVRASRFLLLYGLSRLTDRSSAVSRSTTSTSLSPSRL